MLERVRRNALQSVAASVDNSECLRVALLHILQPGLTTSEKLPNGCEMDWNYWGTGHGKGPHDGAGACVKRALRSEQIKIDSIRLHNASDVVNFLRRDMNLPHAAYPSARTQVTRHFYLIGVTNVVRDKPLACQQCRGAEACTLFVQLVTRAMCCSNVETSVVFALPVRGTELGCV